MVCGGLFTITRHAQLPDRTHGRHPIAALLGTAAAGPRFSSPRRNDLHARGRTATRRPDGLRLTRADLAIDDFGVHDRKAAGGCAPGIRRDPAIDKFDGKLA